MGSASAPAPQGLYSRVPSGPASPSPHLHPQMQVLLAQVQNSEQLLRTLQGTVSQAQERVQLQMVRAGGPGGPGEEWEGTWLRPTWKVETPVLRPSPTPICSGFTLELVRLPDKRASRAPSTAFRQSPPHTQLSDL